MRSPTTHWTFPCTASHHPVGTSALLMCQQSGNSLQCDLLLVSLFHLIVGQKASPPPCLDFIYLCSCWAREKTQFSVDVLRQQERQDRKSSHCCKTSWNEYLIQSFKSLKNTTQNMTWCGNTWDLFSTGAEEQHLIMNKAYKNWWICATHLSSLTDGGWDVVSWPCRIIWWTST